MVWTLPAITNTQLSNVKIFNNGKPIELITESVVDKQTQQETDAFDINPYNFLKNMATELMYLIHVLILRKKQKNSANLSVYELLIQNNRLVYIGVAILLLTTSIWIILGIFF